MTKSMTSPTAMERVGLRKITGTQDKRPRHRSSSASPGGPPGTGSSPWSAGCCWSPRRSPRPAPRPGQHQHLRPRPGGPGRAGAELARRPAARRRDRAHPGAVPDQTFGNDPAMRQAAREVVTALKRLPGAAADIRSPFTTPGLASGRVRPCHVQRARATGTTTTRPSCPRSTPSPRVQARYPGLTVAEAGGASVDRATGDARQPGLPQAEVTSVPVTLVLLLLVFGALIAAGIPLLLAGTAVVSAISLLAIPSRWLPIGSTTSSVVLLVGMAVGIDYSLFYLRRVREERAAGRTTRDALRSPRAPRGGPSWCAGLTVMISHGRAVPHRDRRLLRGRDRHDHRGRRRGAGLADVPAGAAVAAGQGTDRARMPFLGRRQAPPGSPGCGAPSSPGWCAGRWPGRARRRGAAGPGHPAARRCTWKSRASTTARQRARGPHARRIGSAFPGGPAPAEVVVTGDNLTARGSASALTALQPRPRRPTGRSGSRSPRGFGGGHVLVVWVPLAGNGTDARPYSALTRCATRCCPRPSGKCRGSATRWAGRPPAATTSTPSSAHAPWCSLRARAGVRAADDDVPFGLHPRAVDRAQPALGRRRLRPDDLVFQHGHLQGRSASPPTAGSCRGCRCSCSCCCSG